MLLGADHNPVMTLLRRFNALVVAACLPLAPAAAQDQQPRTHEEMHALHRDPKAYIAMLENPARDAYQKPDEVVRALALKPGETVADIGSGSGYFTLRLAAAVGDTGRVYGVDIDPEMIRHLNRRVRDAGVRNVQTVLSEPDDPLLPDASVDRFVIVDTWHHIDERVRYLAKVARGLKPGGRVAVVDFKKGALPVGPPDEHKLAPDQVADEFRRAGWTLVRRDEELLPYQYVLVFAPPAS